MGGVPRQAGIVRNTGDAFFRFPNRFRLAEISSILGFRLLVEHEWVSAVRLTDSSRVLRHESAETCVFILVQRGLPACRPTRRWVLVPNSQCFANCSLM